jgi:ABC-type glucose/galactose transport system permease subunit
MNPSIKDGIGTSVGASVAVGGIVVAVGAGIVNVTGGADGSIGRMVALAGVQEAKIRMTSKTVTMLLFFIDTFLCKELPNGLR